ncbi:Uncharacterised protein [Bordetella pertussis]|nr:Uncharacterised protein [Bordetella pertussis]CFT89478.1 Uncharacterised protein [Bordetella pertussis]
MEITSISRRAASSACFIWWLSTTPSPKNWRLKLTQPMYSEDIRLGSTPLPMMTSVEPPPISITRRRFSEGGRLCATPEKISRASSRPAMTSMGKPSARSARGRKSRVLRATRNVLVATARTRLGWKLRSRSPKRSSTARARASASSPRFLSWSRPAARRTVSLRRSIW